jgi:hypothetical protein
LPGGEKRRGVEPASRLREDVVEQGDAHLEAHRHARGIGVAQQALPDEAGQLEDGDGLARIAAVDAAASPRPPRRAARALAPLRRAHLVAGQDGLGLAREERVRDLVQARASVRGRATSATLPHRSGAAPP